MSGALNTEIVPTATIPTGAVTGPGTFDVSVRIQVAFPYTAATNASQTSTAALDALQLTAVQTHTLAPTPAP